MSSLAGADVQALLADAARLARFDEPLPEVAGDRPTNFSTTGIEVSVVCEHSIMTVRSDQWRASS